MQLHDGVVWVLNEVSIGCSVKLFLYCQGLLEKLWVEGREWERKGEGGGEGGGGERRKERRGREEEREEETGEGGKRGGRRKKKGEERERTGEERVGRESGVRDLIQLSICM